MREFLEILLEKHNYAATVVDGGRAALDALKDNEFDVVLTDLKMPEVSGLEVLRAAKTRYPHTEVVIITAFATADTAISAMKDGAYDYLTKPFKVDEILVTLDRALEKRALVTTNVELRNQLRGRYQLENLVGRSTAMQQVFDLVRRVAKSSTSVLVMGESGTGKELVARAIHTLGERKGKPFVPVNCGAIPETLIESEFFGHIRGSFTGATGDKAGLFSAANGGTIFLDEIGELPLTMQVKLLRTLQERTIKPIGGTREQQIDVRVVAATSRNLDEEVEGGRFRADLFYRLNVIPLILPPLRERREDIALLVEHFLQKYATALNFKSPPRVTVEAMGRLTAYHYPGNVRQLENVIERALTLASGDELDADAFPDLVSTTQRDVPVDTFPEEGLDLEAHVGNIERRLVSQALERTQGNRTEAARLLGISLRSIRYRLAKYGIDVHGEN